MDFNNSVPSVTVVAGRQSYQVDKRKLVDDYRDVFMQTLARQLDKQEEYKREVASTMAWVEDTDGSRLCVTFQQLYRNITRFLEEGKQLQWASGGTIKVHSDDKKRKGFAGATNGRQKAPELAVVCIHS